MEKGQASLEYLVILATMLILSLAVLSFLGFVPDFGISIENRHAENFWRDQARPFTIAESNYLVENRRGYLAIQNMESESLNLSSIYINGSQVAYYEYNATYSDGVGPSALITPGCTAPDCNYSFVLQPRQVRVIVTDSFMSADEICGVGGAQGKVPFYLEYHRRQYNTAAKFTQLSPLELVLTCVRR